MAITRANLPPLLRAATALHPPHYRHNSLTSFLRSHPPNIIIPNPHLFSTFLHRRVRPRATAYPNPLNLSILNQHLVSRSLHTRAIALHKRRRNDDILLYALIYGGIATAGGIMILLYKMEKKPRMFTTVNRNLELRFFGFIPDMYRKGHGVVVELLARPYVKNVRAQGPWEFFISATEVLAQRHHAATAFQRNKTIITVKKIYSEDSDRILATTTRYSLLNLIVFSVY